jgi:tetratricopeptide (TPR) repeat protein
MCWLKVGKFQQAAADSTSVLSSDATNVKALLRRGTASEALGQQAEAAADFQAVLELEPSNREAATKLSAVQGTAG